MTREARTRGFTLVELPAVRRAFTLIELPAVRRAFTLIELLVVIGIIAVLISIFHAAALPKGELRARNIVCDEP